MLISPLSLIKKLGLLFFTFLIVFGFSVQNAQAAKIYKTKKKRIYLKLQGEIVSKGDIFYSYYKGRKKGKIKIYKVKGKKAFGKLVKGKAKKGWKAKMKKYKTASRAKPVKADSPGVGATTFWGLMAGLASSSGKVTIEASSKTVDLSGSAFSVKGLFDYGITNSIWLRGTAGLQGYNIGGAEDTECGGECKANINYLSLDFIGRYMFSLSNMRPWVGGGISVLFPSSNEVTVFKSSSVTNTNLYIIAGGLDYFLSSTSFIPIQVDYNIFPSAANVSSSSIDFRVGYGMEF